MPTNGSSRWRMAHRLCSLFINLSKLHFQFSIERASTTCLISFFNSPTFILVNQLLLISLLTLNFPYLFPMKPVITAIIRTFTVTYIVPLTHFNFGLITLQCNEITLREISKSFHKFCPFLFYIPWVCLFIIPRNCSLQPVLISRIRLMQCRARPHRGDALS